VEYKWIIIEDSEVDLASAGLEKCTRQHAQIAEQKQKFLSNQLKEDLYTAEIVTRSTRTTDQVDQALEEHLLKAAILTNHKKSKIIVFNTRTWAVQIAQSIFLFFNFFPSVKTAKKH
jgi:hypothetical protein